MLAVETPQGRQIPNQQAKSGRQGAGDQYAAERGKQHRRDEPAPFFRGCPKLEGIKASEQDAGRGDIIVCAGAVDAGDRAGIKKNRAQNKPARQSEPTSITNEQAWSRSQK